MEQKKMNNWLWELNSFLPITNKKETEQRHKP